MAAKRPCRWPGCGRACHGGYCDRHADAARQEQAEKDQARGTSAQRGYGYKWQKASKAYLAAHPLCVHCKERDVVTPATVVDHIIPHRGDMTLFWDRSNWQSLCKTHHDIKTATEDGGFGRKG